MSLPVARLAAWLSLIVPLCWAAAAPAAAADRYVAWLSDGQTQSAPRINEWHTAARSRQSQGKGAAVVPSPLRLIRDLHAQVGLAPPFLLLANGDVLTGTPIQLVDDQGRQGLVPRVQVQLEGMLPVSGTGVAVRTDRIVRFVGSAGAGLREEPPPGTVQLADGRRLVARSIKWREYGLALLTSEGIVEANFPDIVDAVFPDVDRMAAVLDDNRWADDVTGIVRFQLATGGAITASRITRNQESSRRSRRSGIELATYYYAQPAWSDQPLALPEKDIAWCGYRGADEAPLSLLPAELAASRRLIGDGAVWQRITSAESGILASGLLEADLGIATCSYSEIACDLPPGAISLVTTVGLDRSVGNGGCVRCSIVAENLKGKVLWDSGILQGSDAPKQTGPTDVVGLSRVVLVTEYAHEGRPTGADPLDIRDQVVWLAPLVKLDRNRIGERAEVLAGISDWDSATRGEKPPQVASRWNLVAGIWDPALILPKGTELTLTRKLHVSPANEIVELLTTCPEELDEHEFRLTVNGEEVSMAPSADWADLKKWVRNLPNRLRSDSTTYVSDELAYWWDLGRWRGQEVTVALTLKGSQETSEICWRGLTLRSAVTNLPDGGAPLAFDVPLTSIAPVEVISPSNRGKPAKDGLPDGRIPSPIRFLGQTFTGGYGLMRESSISFPLDGEYRRFVAIAGCTTFVAGPLQVLIDGQIVWERQLMIGLEPAEQIDVPIPAGAKTLTLQTGPHGSYTGFAAWANAGFVTKEKP
jgi:hypothetical protein